MGQGAYTPELKPKLALAKLTDNESFKDMDTMEAMAIYQEVFEKHIKVIRAADHVVRYDIEGNVLPKDPKKTQTTKKNPYFQSNMMASTFFIVYASL